MRVNKLLARIGVASRRQADELILAGEVTVNGLPVAVGQVVSPSDAVRVRGRPVSTAPVTRPPLLWMHNKPRGVLVSRCDDDARPCLLPDLQARLGRAHLIPCGRLDFNSEGLLLLTDCGELARRITHPAAAIVRRYRLRVRGTVDPAALAALKDGITVRGVHYGPIHATLGAKQEGTNAWVDCTLREGKNRELRNVFEYGLRLQVSRLIRLGFGPYVLPRALTSGDTVQVPNLFDKQ